MSGTNGQKPPLGSPFHSPHRTTQSEGTPTALSVSATQIQPHSLDAQIAEIKSILAESCRKLSALSHRIRCIVGHRRLEGQIREGGNSADTVRRASEEADAERAVVQGQVAEVAGLVQGVVDRCDECARAARGLEDML